MCECTPLCVLTKFGIFINLSCHPVCLCHDLRQGSGKSLRQCLCHCLSTSVTVIVTITASVPLVSFRQCFPDAPTRPFFPKCLLECKCDLCCGLLLGTVTISAVTRLCLASCTEYSGILHLGMLHSGILHLDMFALCAVIGHFRGTRLFLSRSSTRTLRV